MYWRKCWQSVCLCCYRLDELSDDDDDLDFIPTEHAGRSWCTCNDVSCSIQ